MSDRRQALEDTLLIARLRMMKMLGTADVKLVLIAEIENSGVYVACEEDMDPDELAAVLIEAAERVDAGRYD
jgi:hypothetical protein